MEIYNSDLGHEFIDECVHLALFLKDNAFCEKDKADKTTVKKETI